MDVLINSSLSIFDSNANVVCPLLSLQFRVACGSLSVRSTRRAKDAAEEISAFSECHRCSQPTPKCCSVNLQNSTHNEFYLNLFPDLYFLCRGLQRFSSTLLQGFEDDDLMSCPPPSWWGATVATYCLSRQGTSLNPHLQNLATEWMNSAVFFPTCMTFPEAPLPLYGLIGLTLCALNPNLAPLCALVTDN